MTCHLLDANVLIALTVREHVHHNRVSNWAADLHRFALCPIVEGALVRFVVRAGAPAREARRAVQLVQNRPGYEFWPDAVSYGEIDLDAVIGHRQVTDAYLVALARHHDSRLATLDTALVRTWPEHTDLIPKSTSSPPATT